MPSYSKIDEVMLKGELEPCRFVGTPRVGGSLMDTFYGCPRKMFWGSRLGLHLNFAEPSGALTRGTAVHALMCARYKAGTVQEAEALVEAYIKEQLDGWRKQLAADLSGKAEEAIATITRSRDVALAAVRIFWKKYPLDPNAEVIAVEKECVFPIKIESGDTVIEAELGGRLDLVLRDKKQLVHWIADHKSCSKNPVIAHRGRAFSFQPWMYRKLWELESGVSPVGFIYNYLMMPTIKFCAKDKGDFSKYVERCVEWYAGQDFEPMASWPVRFAKGTAAEVEFERQLAPAIIAATEVERAFWDGQWQVMYPRRAARCHDYNRPCEYLGLCESCDGPKGNLAAAIRNNYTQVFADAEAVEEGEQDNGNA